MTTTMKLTRLEGKLFLRDPLALFFGLAFPTTLLLALGYLYPGFTEPVRELDWLRYVDIYSPIAVVLGIATLGLVTLPPILGTYRQLGILRRLGTTPVHPAKLLSAQLTVHFVVATIATTAAVAVAAIAFDVPLPQSPALFAVSLLLAIVSVFSIGLLVGAIARSQASGAALGMAIYFPMLFLAGVWIPRSIMSDGLLTVSSLTPLGAAVQALEDTWLLGTVDVANLVVMAVWSLIVGLVAIRIFRWE